LLGVLLAFLSGRRLSAMGVPPPAACSTGTEDEHGDGDDHDLLHARILRIDVSARALALGRRRTVTLRRQGGASRVPPEPLTACSRNRVFWRLIVQWESVVPTRHDD